MTHVIERSKLEPDAMEADDSAMTDPEAPIPQPAHDPHLAHHYETMLQQHEASKFGMWLFLATELLLFGGLFVLYAVYRGKTPELFAYGSKYMSTALGATNTAVLILSSFTMAMAVHYAQLGKRNALAVMLGLTILGGVGFMCIKYVEYSTKISHGIVWGMAFYDEHPHAALATGDDQTNTLALASTGDPTRGKTQWMNTCLACHGDRGQGMPGQAFDIRDSQFIKSSTDDELVAFIAKGRMGFDPASRTGIQMPPRGGNPRLTDNDLRDIVAHIRTFKPPVTAPAQPDTDTEPDQQVASADTQPPADTEDETQFNVRLLRSSIPPAEIGPPGLVNPEEAQAAQATAAPPPHPSLDPDRPANAHLFFGIYYMMTGLHSIHVLIGMALMAWLLISTLRGRYSSQYYTPVENVGLFWHVIDLIWIFLFPLFYLIH